MEPKKGKTIVVLFTCYRDMFSNILYHLSGKGYTHAFISLNVSSDYYYSFNIKGFRREYPQHYKRQLRGHSVAFYLEISEESYLRIKQQLIEIENASDTYRYTRLGVFFCLLHIVWQRKLHYFCSQFVSELLGLANEIHLTKHPCLYLPNQLAEELSGMACVKCIDMMPV